MKKIILCIILLCIVLLSGCFQSSKYPKYEIEKQDNGQYILTTPDGVSYVTYENNIWYPGEEILGEKFSAAIGKCNLGYIFKTTSEICLYAYKGGGEMPFYFFLADKILPELSIENINNAFLEPTDGNGSKIIVDKEMTEQLIEINNDTEIHEVVNKNSLKRTLELYIECEQFRELYFSRSIYTNGTDYYMYVAYEYDSEEGKYTDFFSKCTSVINNIINVDANNVSTDSATLTTENYIITSMLLLYFLGTTSVK